MSPTRPFSRFFATLAGTLAILGGLGAVAAPQASATQQYYAQGNGLAIRDAPSVTPEHIRYRVNSGAPLDIVCQITGGPNVGGNTDWDQLTNGLWVADYWTSTPSFNATHFPAPGTYDCNNPPSSPGRTWGVTKDHNTAPSGQCTWYVYNKIHDLTGQWAFFGGDAWQWKSTAAANGYTVVLDAQPRSVVVFQPGVDYAGSVGHVAWVERVDVRPDGRYIWITEMNFRWNGQGGPGIQSSRGPLKDVIGMSYILIP